MLGLNNRHAKTNHFIDHPETMTMRRWFREHGYQTCAIGKIDHDEFWNVASRPENAGVVTQHHAMLEAELGPRPAPSMRPAFPAFRKKQANPAAQ